MSEMSHIKRTLEKLQSRQPALEHEIGILEEGCDRLEDVNEIISLYIASLSINYESMHPVNHRLTGSNSNCFFLKVRRREIFYLFSGLIKLRMQTLGH